MSDDKNIKALQDDELSEVSGGTATPFVNAMLTDQTNARFIQGVKTDATKVNTVDLMYRQGQQGQQVVDPATGQLSGGKNGKGNGVATNNTQPIFNQRTLQC